MHKFISLLLVVSILTSGFSRWMLEAGYEMNRGYIADKLCVNKAKPMLHCNGKCYLAKKAKSRGAGAAKIRQFFKAGICRGFYKPGAPVQIFHIVYR